MLLCPSMMCADYGALKDDVRALDEAGADIFHCDVMDGTFVPNITMGLMDVREVRKATKKPVDVHLMVENPLAKVDLFLDAGADIVYIHPESERYVVKTLARVRERDAAAGLAINPDTSVGSIEELLNVVDYLMVMTVNPGFAGQKFIDFSKRKIERLADMKEKYGYKLMVDGACSPSVVRELSSCGADGFVLGTSALFGKRIGYAECLRNLRERKDY
ncbi:ribulose-phosphate 3-epimerase [Olsenella massiliensis]|uniref:ribulose-phosphate 3-epimerase n=1 Tax=Olsenella massiliensis TaxID=1622075 RepID=UPI00071D5DA1|nr:ribulose-phosphate 3-epimerase [Olsenella massiliensis]